MNVEEKVATLEALLARVQNNAAKPRMPRAAAAGELRGDARLGAPEPKAGRAVDTADDRHFDRIDALLTEVPKPVAPKVEKPAAAKANSIDIWTDALAAEAPKAAEKPRVVAPVVARTDVAAPVVPTPNVAAPAASKADVAAAVPPKTDIAAPAVAKTNIASKAEDAASKITPITPASPNPLDAAAAKPATRTTVPTVRSAASRPALGSKPEVTPSPSPASAKLAEVTTPLEKNEPVVASPKPPVVVPAPALSSTVSPKPAPVAAKPSAAVERPPSLDDEIRFDFDSSPPAPNKPAAKPAEKPLDALLAAPVIPPPPPLPVEPGATKRPAREDDLALRGDETEMMIGPPPGSDLSGIVDETTADGETIIRLPDSDGPPPRTDNELAAAALREDADLPIGEPTEAEEATHIFTPRGSQPEAREPTAAKAPADRGSLSQIDSAKVVVSPAVRASMNLEAGALPPSESSEANEVTLPARRMKGTGEITAPSRSYARIESDDLEPLPLQGGSRSSMVLLGLAAAALIGAGVFVGLRNGWFGGSEAAIAPSATSPVVSAKPGVAVAPAPTPSTPSTAGSTTATPAPTASVSASASAAPVASAVPTTTPSASATASTEPAAAPPPKDAASLPYGRGYVIINSTKPASVFLTGNFAGVTGDRLEVDCGAKYLRLAAPPAPGAERPTVPSWTSEGRTISVVCRSTTTITFEASR